jgi:hypothetical protein
VTSTQSAGINRFAALFNDAVTQSTVALRGVKRYSFAPAGVVHVAHLSGDSSFVAAVNDAWGLGAQLVVVVFAPAFGFDFFVAAVDDACLWCHIHQCARFLFGVLVWGVHCVCGRFRPYWWRFLLMAENGRSRVSHERKRELLKVLALWSVMTPTERRMASLPTSRQQWAKHYGVSERAVSNWVSEPDFQVLAERAKSERLASVRGDEDGPGGLPDTSDMSNAEIFGEVVRVQLKMAAAGDKVALDFIKSANISKPFIDQLTADFSSEFPDLDDGELVGRFLDAFEELAVDGLRTRGWKVQR